MGKTKSDNKLKKKKVTVRVLLNLENFTCLFCHEETNSKKITRGFDKGGSLSLQELCTRLKINSNLNICTTKPKPEEEIRTYLCKNCSPIIGRLSNLFKEFERIKTEIGSELGKICNRALEADRRIDRDQGNNRSAKKSRLRRDITEELRRKLLALDDDQTPTPTEPNETTGLLLQNVKMELTENELENDPQSDQQYYDSHFQDDDDFISDDANGDIAGTPAVQSDEVGIELTNKSSSQPEFKFSPEQEISHQDNQNDEEDSISNTVITFPNPSPPTPIKFNVVNVGKKSILFECTVCRKLYSAKSTAIQHYDSIHLKIRHSCHICNSSSFKSKSALRIHIENSCKSSNKPKSSTSRKKYPISKLIQESMMKRTRKRRRRHPGSEPSKYTMRCSYDDGNCKRNFRYKSDLTYHIDKDHLRISFVCEKCGNTYFDKYTLNSHLKICGGFSNSNNNGGGGGLGGENSTKSNENEPATSAN